MIHYIQEMGGKISTQKLLKNTRENNIEPSIIIYCRQGWFFEENEEKK